MILIFSFYQDQVVEVDLEVIGVVIVTTVEEEAVPEEQEIDGRVEVEEEEVEPHHK